MAFLTLIIIKAWMISNIIAILFRKNHKAMSKPPKRRKSFQIKMNINANEELIDNAMKS